LAASGCLAKRTAITMTIAMTNKRPKDMSCLSRHPASGADLVAARLMRGVLDGERAYSQAARAVLTDGRIRHAVVLRLAAQRRPQLGVFVGDQPGIQASGWVSARSTVDGDSLGFPPDQ
jgi:hypothetical protein